MNAKKLYRKEIQELELKRDREFALMKEEIRIGYEYIQPVNVLKRTLSKAAASPEIRSDLLTIGLNLVTSSLTKKIVVGKSESPTKKWLANVIQGLVTTYVSKKGDTIQSGLLGMLHQLLKKLSSINKGPKATSQEAEASETRHVNEAA